MNAVMKDTEFQLIAGASSRPICSGRMPASLLQKSKLWQLRLTSSWRGRLYRWQVQISPMQASRLHQPGRPLYKKRT